MAPSILQSEFLENGFEKTEYFEHNGLLLFFLFTLDSHNSFFFSSSSSVLDHLLPNPIALTLM